MIGLDHLIMFSLLCRILNDSEELELIDATKLQTQESPLEEEKQTSLRRRKGRSEEEKSDDEEHEEETKSEPATPSRDPIYWFSGMPPFTLRHSQQSFQRGQSHSIFLCPATTELTRISVAMPLLVQLANISRSMSVTEAKINELQKSEKAS